MYVGDWRLGLTSVKIRRSRAMLFVSQIGVATSLLLPS